MGRELQKRKNRSSIAKVRRKPKSKKQLLNHPVIAANWDKAQTLAQNYRRLGLTVKLNKNTGGIEKKVSDVPRVESGEQLGGYRKDDALSIAHAKRPEQIDVTEAKIERDPKTGRILRIVEEGTKKANPLHDPLDGLDSDSEDMEDEFDQHGNAPPSLASAMAVPKTAVVGALEQQASRPVAKHKRRQPEGERAFIAELVKKHGEDYGKMARDVKINYMQRSEGDLKKRVKKWRESGGVVE